MSSGPAQGKSATGGNYEESEVYSVKVIKFNGNSDRYNEWAIKFMALASIKNYETVLTGDETPPDDKTRYGTLSTDEKRLRKANRIAYSQLLLSCDEEACPYVRDAVTSELPKGNAHEAWKNLQEKFAPSEMADKVDKLGEFTKCILLEPSEDPDKWMRRLDLIVRELKASFKITKSEDDVIAHIYCNLPVSPYGSLLDTIDRDLNSGKLKLDELKAMLRRFYKRMKDQPKFQEGISSGNKLAMAFQYGRSFKGTCYNCGKQGHRSNECHSPKVDRGSNDWLKNITCFKCKEKGHKAKDCPKKGRNPDVMQHSGMFVGVSTSYLPTDETWWLGDTGATAHVTNDVTDLQNKMPSNGEVTMADT